MKIIAISLFLFLEIITAHAQFLEIHKTDGSIKFDTVVVTSITYTEQMEIRKSNGLVKNYELADIDSITFVPGFDFIPCPESLTVTDIDGNVYNTVQIKFQCWMAENLKVTHYPNGASIPLITDNAAWLAIFFNDTAHAYCYYNNNSGGEADTYGALYTWGAAMGENGVSSSSNPSGVQGACPNGWHLPSDDEWKELEMALGMSQTDADLAGGTRGTNEGCKLAGNSALWNSSIISSNAEFGTSGFTCLPGGWREGGGGGSSFHQLSAAGSFWTSTEETLVKAWKRDVYSYTTDVHRISYRKSSGRSVRCLLD